MTFKDLILEKELTPQEFIEKVEKAFKKHFPNGFVRFEERNSFGNDGKYISGTFGMIGNPRDNTNGIPENDKMRHTVVMHNSGDNYTYQFKGAGKIYIQPLEGSYNAMDSIKTKLGNNTKITLDKAYIKLEKFFKKLSDLMKEHKNEIYGVENINPKYLVFK